MLAALLFIVLLLFYWIPKEEIEGQVHFKQGL